MTGRIILAGVAGAIVMFIWASIAHMSPLGMVGIKTLPAASETAVLEGMKSSAGDQGGMFIGPAAAMETMRGSGPLLLAVYRPNASYELSPMQLIGEFVLELIQCLILAFLLSKMIASVAGRIIAAVAAGVMVGISTHGSYHVWFGFPHDYTLAQIGIQVVEYLVAGIAIALILPRQTATA